MIKIFNIKCPKIFRHLSLILYNFLFHRERQKFISKDANEIQCYRIYDGNVKAIKSLAAVDAASELGTKLIQHSGLVAVDGKVFDLSESGVYGFYKLNSISE